LKPDKYRDLSRAPTISGELPPPLHLQRVRATLQWSAGGKAPTIHVAPESPLATEMFKPGDRIGDNYVVKGVLGAGGMGQVYEAQDTALNRVVAVKVAWPHVGREALRREAQVLAAFRNPALVTAHALGKHGELEYLVMERITGAPLSDLLLKRGGKLPIDETLGLLINICDTLVVLHASGLAHCDLKPANIMLAAGDRLVLLDFGIVRVEQMRGEARMISGSPHYMAPETIRGVIRAGETHLVDIYAMGVIAFVLLTGRAPFDDADPRQLMLQHIEMSPPHLRDLLPDAPIGLDRLIDQMLSKLPEERPDRIEIVRDELRVLQKRLPA
jgi:serine/threonine-protein kinase